MIWARFLGEPEPLRPGVSASNVSNEQVSAAIAEQRIALQILERELRLYQIELEGQEGPGWHVRHR